MAPRRTTGAASSAVALALVSALNGAPAILSSVLEPEHRCQCPAGRHVCACPRCAAKAARAAKAPCHGKAGHAQADPAAAKPPCHGGARAPAEGAPEKGRPLPDAPCLTTTCHGSGPVATLAAGADPFLVQQRPARAGAARVEPFAPPLLLASATPAAPEPPPPRA